MIDDLNKIIDRTVILCNRDHSKIGVINNCMELNFVDNLNSANEISFYVDEPDEDDPVIQAELMRIWDNIVDFKYVFVAGLNEYYEITVDITDGAYITKNITGISACEAELGQSLLYNLEINTEADIKREDYKSPTIFYDEQHPENSLLNRVLYKLPQYSIKYVDFSLQKIQRTFSADDKDVYSFLTGEVAEEIGCLFKFDSSDRTISAYDLKTVCLKCGHRGEYQHVCPKCGSTDLKYFGEDTTIFVDKENLSDSVTYNIDTESVKNCFKLKAGDDNMTAAIKNRNPNGSDYIYYFSPEQRDNMPKELVDKIDSYDALVQSYDKEYGDLIQTIYDSIDKVLYYTSEMMPKRENTPSTAKQEAAKLTVQNLSPLGLSKLIPSTSVNTVNSALNEYVRVFIKTGWFTAKVNESRFVYVGDDSAGHKFGSWSGNFKVVNNSDKEDTAISDYIEIRVDDNYKTFLEQKIKRKLLDDSEKKEGSIFDVLSIEELEPFKVALTYYALNRLISFKDSLQGCIDIMIEADQAKENSEMYEELYVPYLNKLNAVQEEMDKRSKTIEEYKTTLKTSQERQREIQKILDFNKYLGADLYKTFCCYKREQTFSNDNYVSKGLDNKKLFENAGAFFEVAKDELIKSGSHNHSISANLFNLLAIPEFKPLKNKFKLGNFIRVGVGNNVFRLRLIQRSYSLDDIGVVNVEFSDATKTKNGMTDTKDILDRANSMASSYGYVTNQVKDSKDTSAIVADFVDRGLEMTKTKIINDADNQDIVFDERGLVARQKVDFTDEYNPCQVKLLNTGLYVTSNNWYTVSSAIGKYVYIDPVTGEEKIKFGLMADSIVGKLIVGNALSLISDNASISMSIDDHGFVLNAKKDEANKYKKIFDIQKDGESQVYIDSDGNFVLKTNQINEMNNKMTEVKADIDGFSVKVDEKILDSEQHITESYTSSMEATSKDILFEVRQAIDANNVDIDSKISSNNVHLTDEFTDFVRTSVQDVENIIDGKVSSEYLREYVRFAGASVEIGKSDSPFKTLITNEKMSFYQGVNEVAYISNNEMYILKANILKELQIGNYKLVDEGPLGFSIM